MILNKMMLNIWTKWVIDFEHRKNKPDVNIGPKLIKYQAYQVNKLYHTYSKR